MYDVDVPNQPRSLGLKAAPDYTNYSKVSRRLESSTGKKISNLVRVKTWLLRFEDGDGEDDSEAVTEADQVFFEELKEALKLRETSSSQLSAVLICRAIPNFVDCDMFRLMPSDEPNAPIICDAMRLLEWDDGFSEDWGVRRRESIG